jgi:hypothetical protein
LAEFGPSEDDELDSESQYALEIKAEAKESAVVSSEGDYATAKGSD